jgi:superfamily I DNA/RNA helicase/mRNA-degrading endonuclease RelE of RelBE toxin-antitoxin system
VDFRIADSFTDSLARLAGDEQKAVKTTAFDLQMNPVNPGMQMHRIDKSRDKNFWSVRVGGDIRLILHKTAGSLLLCYVDHHDRAYQWAERRRLETHPMTGAAQFVEIRERIQEVLVPAYEVCASQGRSSEPLFSGVSDAELLHYGVPADWVGDVRTATEESLLTLAQHLPAEAAEALLELATGGKPKPRISSRTFQVTEADQVQHSPKTSDAAGQVSSESFAHPDAQRRFHTIDSVDELQRALEFPWEKWTVFLHPEQRDLVERDYNGPARVSGSAGTGKTIVALHRAAHLARKHSDARVLLTTFSEPLAHALQTRLRRLVSNEPRLAERIDVAALPAVGVRLYKALCGPMKAVTRKDLEDFVRAASATAGGHRFSLHFLLTEWEQVVDVWQLESWDAYRDVARLGRKTRLPEAQRQVLWKIFELVRTELAGNGMITDAGAFAALSAKLHRSKTPPYDFVVVDEAQDITVSQLTMLAALGGGRTDALFFAGDLGQRIFQQPFSWKSLGVEVRGRSHTLKVNYRTSHQIRLQADRLLGPEITDVDGNREDRRHTISVFNGSPPEIQTFESEGAESKGVGQWLAARAADGMQPHELAVFVRSAAEVRRAQHAVDASGLVAKVLDDRVEAGHGFVSVCTMHLAKGLEFRAVSVIACDDEILPLQERMETVGDDADLQEIYDTERQLLYVACTRARDRLLVTGVSPESEFLTDMGAEKIERKRH